MQEERDLGVGVIKAAAGNVKPQISSATALFFGSLMRGASEDEARVFNQTTDIETGVKRKV